jgi:hypothetical protein
LLRHLLGSLDETVEQRYLAGPDCQPFAHWFPAGFGAKEDNPKKRFVSHTTAMCHIRYKPSRNRRLKVSGGRYDEITGINS